MLRTTVAIRYLGLLLIIASAVMAVSAVVDLFYTGEAFATLLVTLMGAPLLEAFTGTVACMGNVGPGMGMLGSLGHYNGLSDGAKLVLTAVMVIGRLEIFGFLLLFTPRFWKSA